MGTTIRPELSEKNEHYISKHRYYELKHFCLQYPEWRKQCVTLIGYGKRPEIFKKPQGQLSDPTAWAAERRDYYTQRIELVERTARLTDESLYSYIVKAVTLGLSYETLKTTYDIPCCRDTYYRLYRKFFCILDKERG